MGLISVSGEGPWVGGGVYARMDIPKTCAVLVPGLYITTRPAADTVFSVAAIPEQLQGQMSVLRYFASYMEQHLMKVSAGAQGWTLGHGLTTPLGLVGLPACRLWPGGC